MNKIALNGAVPGSTAGLVQLRAGPIIGSTYHTVRQTDLLREAAETEERITAAASRQNAPYFTARTSRVDARGRRAHTEPTGERVPDELFAQVSAH